MVIEARQLVTARVDELNFADKIRKRVFFAPPVIFVYLLFVRGLILDGWPGWFYVLQRTLAETLLSLRLLTARQALEDGAESRNNMSSVPPAPGRPRDGDR
jgi:hypothetical protein